MVVIRVILTLAFFKERAASRPPNPAPIIIIWGKFIKDIYTLFLIPEKTDSFIVKSVSYLNFKENL